METVQVRGTSIDLVRRGKGPPLLFLHSGAGPVSHSATYLEQMTEKFDVIAPVHPGFGLQKRPDCVKTVDDLAYHYLDLMHALGLNEVIPRRRSLWRMDSERDSSALYATHLQAGSYRSVWYQGEVPRGARDRGFLCRQSSRSSNDGVHQGSILELDLCRQV